MFLRTAMALAVVASSIAPLAAQANLPVISTASADPGSGILTLRGENFGDKPFVQMAQEELELVSASDRLIEAKLKTIAPGTYSIVVRRDPKTQPNHVATIDVTIGAVGAQGPPGERGPQGERGL